MFPFGLININDNCLESLDPVTPLQAGPWAPVNQQPDQAARYCMPGYMVDDGKSLVRRRKLR